MYISLGDRYSAYHTRHKPRLIVGSDLLPAYNIHCDSFSLCPEASLKPWSETPLSRLLCAALKQGSHWGNCLLVENKDRWCDTVHSWPTLNRQIEKHQDPQKSLHWDWVLIVTALNNSITHSYITFSSISFTLVLCSCSPGFIWQIHYLHATLLFRLF